MRRCAIYFVLCTNVPLEEGDVLLAGHPMVAKKRLGREIVEQYHGADAATEAQAAFEKQFSRGEMPDDIEEVQIDGTVEYSVATLLRDCFGVSPAKHAAWFNKMPSPLTASACRTLTLNSRRTMGKSSKWVSAATPV
jgi:tyrosyl-tRNA synthetase